MVYEIPFTLLKLDDDSYHPLIEAFVNNVLCNLIIDTGASRSVFDLNFFNIPFVEMKHGKEIIPAGIIEGSIENKSGIISEFTLGEFKALNLEGVFISLDHINKLYRQIENAPLISGLLGSDFLAKYKAVIDYNKTILKLRNSSFR
jgi:hypothetical protein